MGSLLNGGGAWWVFDHMQKSLALLLALALPACSAEEVDPTETATMATVSGTVRDADGNALAGVIVRHLETETTTDGSGSFSVAATPGTPAVLTFHKDGFVRGLERIDVTGATPTSIRVSMVAMAPAIPFDSSAGGTAVGMRGATITAPAESFRTQDGTPITGMVDVHLTPLNPSIQAELEAYPGDGTAVDAEGETITLETFGVLDVTVMQDGEELNIRDGMGVDIKVPLPDPLPAEPPETIALWGFDDEAGVWVEEGIATLNLEEGVYEGTISHLSPWNCDQPMSATCISGHVLQDDGADVPGAYVIANGIDYAGNTSAVADAEGHFCVPVRKDSDVEIVIYHPGGGEMSQNVRSGGEDTDIPPVCTDPRCLDVGEFVLGTPSGEDTAGGWDGTCGFGDDAELEMSLSGAVNETIEWSGDPWLGICGGVAGAAGGGMVGMFFMNDAVTNSSLDIFISVEADPGDTGEFPMTLMMADDILSISGTSWISAGGCTANITTNAPVAPGLFTVEGTGSCSAPLDPYPSGEGQITVDGSFNFRGIILFGDVAADSLIECCYGG